MNFRIGIGVALGVFVIAQWIPYGRDHSNPPMTREPVWDVPETRALFFEACRDCHSNETRWPWYSHLAPFSWLVQRDVELGRSHFNVSEWDRSSSQHGDEAAEMVEEGEMPLRFYLSINPHARLSSEQRNRLVNGLVDTFGRAAHASGETDHDHDHDHDDHHHHHEH